MSQKIRVGVLGATGTVGERLVRMLRDHPWFDLVQVAASDSSAGATLAERLPPSEDGDLSEEQGALVLRSVTDPWDAPLLLSALPSGVAAEVEEPLARRGHTVVSNASTHRMDPRVPLIVPEINPDHLDLLDGQKSDWSGALLTNPNCVVAGVAVALAPLDRAFGVDRVVVTTFQAISGAGRPGPPAADLVDNVVPYIAGEEEKIGRECRKILGRLEDGRVVDADFVVSATATRVPVTHGHLASLSVSLRDRAGPAEVADALRSWRGGVAGEGLPLAPARPVEVLDGDPRPQPRIDRERGRGMTVTVGRIRPCEVHDVKMMVLSHNLVRGAAGAALLNAELCAARGLLASDAATPAGGPARG